jgi:hypothetical protein
MRYSVSLAVLIIGVTTSSEVWYDVRATFFDSQTARASRNMDLSVLTTLKSLYGSTRKTNRWFVGTELRGGSMGTWNEDE